MFQIISGTSKTVSGTQNLERNVPNTAQTNVPTNSVLLGTLFLLVFPVNIEHKWVYLTFPKLLQRGFGKGVLGNNSEGSFGTKLPK
jgi:hypothetical protein